MKRFFAVVALASIALLPACGQAGNLAAPKVMPAAAAQAAAAGSKLEVATPELLARLFAGHRAYQGLAIVGPSNKDAALLTSYDGRQLMLEGTVGLKRSTSLFVFKYLTPTATLADGSTLAFTSQEFLTNAKADAFIAKVPVGKQAQVTFTVRRFSFRSDTNSPFVFESATVK